MFRRALVFASLSTLPFASAASGQARSITLNEAVTQALSRHVELRAANADVAVARGELVLARTITYNPEFIASVGPATSLDTNLTNREFGLSQTIELGGKRSRRSQVASLRLDAAESRRARRVALVAWNAQRAFYTALVARERLAAAAEADTLGRALLMAAQDRLTLGSGTQLEVNVAAAAHARDRRTRLDAERLLASALFELRAAVGAGVRDSIVPSGELPRLTMPVAPLDSVVSVALGRRPDFAAVRGDRGAAEANVRLARSLAWPDPQVGVSSGRTEDFQVTVFSIALPLPLWNRSQGDNVVARAALERARVAEDSARRVVELEVRDAYQALTSALASRDALETQAVALLTENLALARESFEAGKISLFIYNTIRRELVESRLAYFDALTETVERRYAFALATGEPWE